MRDLSKDWDKTQLKISTEQHGRNRNIIREIIETTKKFKVKVNDKFSVWRQEDLEDQ